MLPEGPRRAMLALAGFRRPLAAAARSGGGGAMPRKVQGGEVRGGGGGQVAPAVDRASSSVSGKSGREGARGTGRRRGTGGGGGRGLREGGGSRQARLPVQRRHWWGPSPPPRLPASPRPGRGAAGREAGSRERLPGGVRGPGTRGGAGELLSLTGPPREFCSLPLASVKPTPQNNNEKNPQAQSTRKLAKVAVSRFPAAGSGSAALPAGSAGGER